MLILNKIYFEETLPSDFIFYLFLSFLRIPLSKSTHFSHIKRVVYKRSKTGDFLDLRYCGVIVCHTGRRSGNVVVPTYSF